MLRGEVIDNRSTFDYYLRQCEECQEIFKAETKRGGFCPECKAKRIKARIAKSIETRRNKAEVKMMENENV